MFKSSLVAMAAVMGITYSAQALVVLPEEVVHQVEFYDTPQFFYKPSPDGKYVAFTAYRNQNSRGDDNYIMDLATGEKTGAPGPWDPYFALNSELMVAPTSGASAYQFFLVEDIMRDGSYAEPLITDRSMHGYYQSLGILNEDNFSITYRMVVERGNTHWIRSYVYDKRAQTVKALGQPVWACSNQRIKLPMLSKDGREIGALSLDSNTSKVFRLLDDGTCIEQLNVGRKVGKLGFSYDGRYIAYHEYDGFFNRQNDSYTSVPTTSSRSDIFIYDRVAKKETRVTNNIQDNSIYPEFLWNGDLIVANYPRDRSKPSSFVILRPNLSESPAERSKKLEDKKMEYLNSGRVPEIKSNQEIRDRFQADGVEFRDLFIDVIQPKCLSCHNSSTATMGVNLENRAAALQQVIPGDFENSRLYHAVTRNPEEGPRMPVGDHLDREEIIMIEQWIQQGAK